MFVVNKESRNKSAGGGKIILAFYVTVLILGRLFQLDVCFSGLQKQPKLHEYSIPTTALKSVTNKLIKIDIYLGI